VGADAATTGRRVILKSGEAQEVGVSITVPVGVNLQLDNSNGTINGPAVVQSYIPSFGARTLYVSADNRSLRAISAELRILINENLSIPFSVIGAVVAHSPSPSPTANYAGRL
jgi:hypothetical protein